MNADPPLKNLKQYFQEPFSWFMKNPIQKFYDICYELIKRKYYAFYWRNYQDFEDILHTSMETFCIKIQNGEYHFKTNGHAFNYFRKIFKTDKIDYYRKKTTQEKKYKIYKQDFALDEDSIDLNLTGDAVGTQQMFTRLDYLVIYTPLLLSQREKEFYNEYKKAFPTATDEDDIKTTIMQTMKISAGYYSKLKTEITKKFRKINKNYNPLS